MPDNNISFYPTTIHSSTSHRSGIAKTSRLVEKVSDKYSPHHSPKSSSDTNQYNVTIVTGLEEIASLLSEWRELFSKMLLDNTIVRHVPPFARPDVLACWAKAARAEIDSLFVVTLRDQEKNELRGVFPGFIYKGAIRLLSDDVTDYQEITALSIDDGVALVNEVIKISHTKGCRLALYKVSDSSLLWACLQILSQSVCCLVKRLHGPCPHRNFEVPRVEGDFLNSLSKKRRKNYKAAVSKIRKGIPNGKIKHVRGEEITNEVIEAIAKLHIDNQYRKQGESIFENQSMKDWLLSLANVDSGLCIALFYDREELAAFNLSFVDIEEKVFYYYIPSFSDKYLNYSLGTWLLVESLRHHSPAGGGTFRLDLLCGDEGYKKMWSTDRYHVWRMILFPNSISTRPLYYFYRSIYALKVWKNQAKAFIDLRLKSR